MTPGLLEGGRYQMGYAVDDTGHVVYRMVWVTLDAAGALLAVAPKPPRPVSRSAEDLGEAVNDMAMHAHMFEPVALAALRPGHVFEKTAMYRPDAGLAQGGRVATKDPEKAA